ncbi:MAG: sigma-70 family RNA polymerase sigma factor, partial [Chloroflexi bacterium]|nr:sigma-70 family RNA polymerase sigma factor [Chloroflexota bacterium]
ETAADLTEMTFEKALRSWDRAPREHLEAWLFRIATNCGRDTYRQCRRWQPLAVLEASQRTVLVAPDAPEREAIRSEQRDLLSQALAQLPARRRAALLFRTKQALSYGEIGTALGITPGAAKQLLFRARQELRVRYLALGGEPLEE